MKSTLSGMPGRQSSEGLTRDVVDYTSVTEVPGGKVSREAMDMVWTRYVFAGTFCVDKTVLEVACGPGVGLGYLAARARRVYAGDYTTPLLSMARARYGTRIPLARLDAHLLPFRDGVFDVIVLFEAVYFLSDIGQVVESCHRVLRPGGLLIIVTVNPEWHAFNPSPFSTRYLSAAVLKQTLDGRGYSTELFGGFPVTGEGVRGKLLGAVKRMAVRMHLIPRTMKGRELLKRAVFGRLEVFPADITEMPGTYREPVPLADPALAGIFKVLYAVARKDAG